MADNPLIPQDLALAAQYESGWRNVPNYMFGPQRTASGIWQITDSTWNDIAPKLGLQKLEYPASPMDRPYNEQLAVAQQLHAERGMAPWAPYNPLLRQALAEKGYGTGLLGAMPTPEQLNFSAVRSPLEIANETDDVAATPPVLPSASLPAGYGAGHVIALLGAMGAFGTPPTHKFEPVDYDPWKVARGTGSNMQVAETKSPSDYNVFDESFPQPGEHANQSKSLDQIFEELRQFLYTKPGLVRPTGGTVT